MITEKASQARVISVMGAKGGVGQTLVAVNLAISLREETHKKVALLDFNFQVGGELSLLLNLSPPKSLADLTPIIERLNYQLIKGFLTSHSSGVDLLCGVSSSAQAKEITSQHIDRIIKSLRPVYDYIVINTERTFSDTLTATFDNSDITLA